MKKIMIMLVAMMMLLSGCSATPTEETTSTETPAEETSASTEETVEETAVEYDVPVTIYERTGSDFEKWCDEYFKESMESDFLNLHFTVVDYEALGIEKPELTWGEISYENYEEDLIEINNDLEELKAFDYETLSDCEKVYYDNLVLTLEANKVMCEHPDLEWYFQPGSPINDSLITNMNEFVFRNEQDVKDYLVMLADMDRYLLDMMTFTEQQAEKGYFMQDNAALETIEMLDDFAAKVDDNALIVGFDHKMDEMEFDTTSYKEENAKIIKEQIIPAWNETSKRLEALLGTCDDTQVALTSFEGGKEYYEALLKYKSSSNYSVDEIFDMLIDYLDYEDYKFYEIASSDDGDGYMEFMSFEFDKMEPLDALNIHEENMYRYVPYGPEVNYTATYLDESIANDSVIAYYLPPCIDEIENNVIKVNPHQAGDDMAQLWTTMSHEGFPGHLYQNTYFLATNPHPINKCLGMIGYSEGWAMHSELYCYDWTNYKKETTADIARYEDVIMGYVMACICDIGIQYKGWTPEGIAEFYSTMYGQEITAEQVFDTYEYYAYRPGMLIPYGFGMTEMQTLMYVAQEALGDDFSDIEFNGVILNYGERTFENVEKDVAAYIISKGGTINE